MTLEALDAVRKRVLDGKPDEWVRSPFTPFVDGRGVLCFDPSLSKTGWALVVDTYPFVVETGVLATRPLDGEEGNLRRGVSIFEQARVLMDRLSGRFLFVAHEAPPASSSGLFRTDSTKSAGLAVRIAAADRGYPVLMVSDTHAKKRMVGRVREVRKADMKAALSEFWGHLPLDGMRWNEDIRDAVVVGIIAQEEYGASHG